MKLKNYYYITSEQDLEKAFELIKDNYDAMKSNMQKAELNQFKETAVGNACVRINWKMEFFLPEDKEIIIATDEDND